MKNANVITHVHITSIYTHTDYKVKNCNQHSMGDEMESVMLITEIISILALVYHTTVRG